MQDTYYKKIKVWKTINLDTGLKTAADFCVAIKNAGMFIDNWGNDILGKLAFIASTKETKVDLIVVSNAGLGFKEGAKLKDTYARALELGLCLCPNEVGPQLRFQYKDQPNGESLIIAMESIIDSGDNPRLFRVVCASDSEKSLNGCHGHPDHVWRAGALFVFCRRK